MIIYRKKTTLTHRLCGPSHLCMSYSRREKRIHDLARCCCSRSSCYRNICLFAKSVIVTTAIRLRRLDCISPAAGLCAKSIISPGRTDTEIYFQSGRTENRFIRNKLS